MSKSLAKDNRTISIFLILAGAIAYAAIAFVMIFWFPVIMHRTCYSDWEWYSDTYLPLLVFGEACGGILFAAVTIYEIICIRIGKGRSFCHENARSLRWIFFLLLLLAILLFASGFIFPKLGIVSLYVCLLALMFLAVAVLAWALGRLVEHAVVIKEENDLVI